MILNELFDNPIPWKWVSKNEHNWEAGFDIGNMKYALTCAFAFQFVVIRFETRATGDTGITGTGNEIAVFATVIDIVKEIIDVPTVKTIVFTAKEKSRQKLYNRLVKLFEKMGWSVSTNEKGDEGLNYVCKRPEQS